MIWSGFILGLAGSLHCAGMCGPLMLISGNNNLQGAALHHTGRIISYILLGAIASGIAGISGGTGWQSWLSVALGMLLIFMASGQLLKYRFSFAYRPWNGFMRLVLKQKGWTKSLLAGLAHGLLPCGLSFAAAVAAAAMPHFTGSMAYMTLFAFGTLPALTGFQWLVAPMFKHRKCLTAFVMAATGIWLIVRGWLEVVAPGMDVHCG